MLGLILVGFIITILLLYKRRQQKQEEELQRMRDAYEKEELKSQLEIQENTFKTIGQELHDNIGQMLSVVKLSLSVLPISKEHKAFDQIENSRQILNKAIVDLSNLTKSLHTDRIAQVGLADSIRYECGAISKAGILSVRYDILGDEEHMDDQKSIFLFRIFQEAINNVLKHAMATEVEVILNYLDNRFSMEISDNGQGFNVSEKRHSANSFSGVGLKSIFNRAKLIGAELRIDSKPGEGTRILIELPLEQADN
ncbi:MAG: sensor histidine kinase [Chitinophagaceae bacterium]|nr:sensor histidine kinase [Chitinophagaceae bacterium]